MDSAPAIRHVPSEAWFILFYVVGAIAVSPYFLQAPAHTEPLEFALGYLPWLIDHPVRLLATLPLGGWIFMWSRGPY